MYTGLTLYRVYVGVLGVILGAKVLSRDYRGVYGGLIGFIRLIQCRVEGFGLGPELRVVRGLGFKVLG